MHNIANSCLKTTKRPKKLPHKKWFDYDCKQSKTRLNKLAQNLSKQNSEPEANSNYFSARNKHNRLIQKKRYNFLSRLNSAIEDGHVLDWKKFRNLKQNNEENPLLDKYDLLSFYEYFTELYKKRPLNFSNLTPNNDNHNINDKSEGLNGVITFAEVGNALAKLRLGKSPSEDRITNDMLKCMSTQGKITLRKIFNHCLSNGLYPWHTSIITPLFKSGNAYNPDNYRAIAVGSCLGKLFSTILLDRLTVFRAEYCQDPISQLGFKKGSQTNDHILTLKTLIDKYTKVKKTKLYVCFVDLRKAFDTVCREFLLYKLVKLDICGNFFSVIEDMYTKSCARIKIDNLLSSKISMERGTEQGHPLSPDLFKIFIRDLSELFQTIGDYPTLNKTIVSHLLWADDLVLSALSKLSLQSNINTLNTFCNSWDLHINIKKTKIMIFGKKKHERALKFLA